MKGKVVIWSLVTLSVLVLLSVFSRVGVSVFAQEKELTLESVTQSVQAIQTDFVTFARELRRVNDRVDAVDEHVAALESAARTITVVGYGSAKALPNEAKVFLRIGEEPDYGPGPELNFVEPADLEQVREFLLDNGIDEEAIEIDDLAHSRSYPTTDFVGDVRFQYSDLDGLKSLLQGLYEDLDDRRGPYITGALVVFLVEDCPALEAAAIEAAFDNARERAVTMARFLKKELGDVVAVSEDLSSGSGRLPGGCIALESLGGPRIYSHGVYSVSEANNKAEVEVGILVKATFTLE